MFDFGDSRPARPIDTVRTQAEQLGLRIVELSTSRYLVTSNGQVVFRAASMHDLRLCLELRQAEP